METRMGRRTVKPGPLAIEKVHKKLALPLWVKMQHSNENQYFDVLLTLTREPKGKDSIF